MITDPYRADAAQLVTSSHRQVIRTSATVDGAAVDLPAASGTFTMAEDWSPYIKGTLRIPAAGVDLDPRRYDRLQVSAGYVFPGGAEDVHQVAAGYVHSVTDAQPGDVLEVEIWSAEGRCQDAKWLGSPALMTFAGVREAVEWAVSYALGGPGVFAPGIPFDWNRSAVSQVTVDPGTSMWEIISSIALHAGVRVWCDHLNVWQIQPKTTIAGTSASYLRTGAGGTVDTFTHRRDLDPYYSAALLIYTWEDAAGDEVTRYGRYSTAAGDGSGRRTFVKELTGPIDQLKADDAARTTIRNLSTRGDSYTVESVIMWWLRPGHTVQLSLGRVDVRHIVKRVTFNLGNGKMTVETREPSNLGD